LAKKKVAHPAYIALFVAATASICALAFYYFNKPNFVKYTEFGIDIPANYTIHGIDVSHYQRNINWDEVKAMQINKITISFAFVKATEGTTNIDENFISNWKGAEKANIIRGAYHFFNPNTSGKAQAQNFIETVVLHKGDMPPVLDIEQIGNASKLQLQQRVNDWLTTVEAFYKVKPMVYTGATFYDENLAGKFDAYPLWVAHYLVKDKPRVKKQWQFWQHNQAGHVNGISTFVDFNVFNGDSTNLKSLLLK
jgi:lysozyme